MYDLAVIGGGPAGYSAALEAVSHDLNVILFEKDQLGGTCLNRGCVPTKYFSSMARRYQEMVTSEKNGILCPDVFLDFQRMQQRKTEIVNSLKEGLCRQLTQKKIDIIYGIAHIMDAAHIICDGSIYETRNILIASGSVNRQPVINGAITSDELLELSELPAKIRIIGGGAVAVEFAEIFRMFGCCVTVSVRGSRILRKWDKEIAQGITQSMKRRGIQIQTECDFAGLQMEEGELVLSAVGRIPDVKKSDCFQMGNQSGIVVDGLGRTGTQGVFAAGDVVEGSSMLAHTAMDQGRRVARIIAGVSVEEKPVEVRCICMGQEAAMAGMTALEAEEEGREIVTAKQTMYANARTQISTEERGFVKIVAEKKSGCILGAQLLCERASDIVAELALAINKRLTARDLLCSMRPHPSYCEAVTDAVRLLEEKRCEI